MSERIPTFIERIERNIKLLTPDPPSFGSIYPTTEIKGDLEQLASFKKTPDYTKGSERSDAKLLEMTFTEMIEDDDWFSEDESYGEDPEFAALMFFPPTEVDDTFNHVDAIGVIHNEDTSYESIPFAIDLTYNIDPEKIRKKFTWKHVYGKTSDAPKGISEFGKAVTETTPQGETIVKTKPLPLRFRQGLKIPGFASAKYFEDRNDIWNPIYPKGRIKIMPRFVVGYSTDIADTLTTGQPTVEFKQKYGEQAYARRMHEFETAKKRAKWCTLVECSKQATDVLSMLDKLSEKEIQKMPPEELATAKKQIKIMITYITKAIEIAKKKAETDPDEKAAMEYTSRDPICQAILVQSSLLGQGDRT